MTNEWEWYTHDTRSCEACSGGRCCHCDGGLQFVLTLGDGAHYRPCRRPHAYWRKRIIQIQLLPAIRRLMMQKLNDLFDDEPVT